MQSQQPAGCLDYPCQSFHGLEVCFAWRVGRAGEGHLGAHANTARDKPRGDRSVSRLFVAVAEKPAR